MVLHTVNNVSLIIEIIQFPGWNIHSRAELSRVFWSFLPRFMPFKSKREIFFHT